MRRLLKIALPLVIVAITFGIGSARKAQAGPWHHYRYRHAYVAPVPAYRCYPYRPPVYYHRYHYRPGVGISVYGPHGGFSYYGY